MNEHCLCLSSCKEMCEIKTRMSISLTRKVRNVLTKNRQCNNKNKWLIKHNTCNEILSNSNQLKTGGRFRYDMLLRKTNILSTF